LATLPDPQPKPDEVAIEVEAFGLNFADVMARHGLSRDAPPRPSVLGYEVVGRVAALGQTATGVEVGQRVIAFSRFGGYATRTLVPALAVMPIPEDMPAGEATALVTQYCTAYYCAHVSTTILPGDHVLVQAAAGGVGTALVQMAKAKGAFVYGTAGSDAKLNYLKAQGVDVPINYNAQDFEQVIRQHVGSRGIDLVFDSLGGETFRKGRALLGSGGRIVAFGMAERSGGGGGQLATIATVLKMGWPHPVMHLMQCQGIIGVNMLRIGDDRPYALKHCLEQVLLGYQQGIYKPVVGGYYPHTQLAHAHNELEKRRTIGKIAVFWEK
jgi:NADPH2:quinone reductase